MNDNDLFVNKNNNLHKENTIWDDSYTTCSKLQKEYSLKLIEKLKLTIKQNNNIVDLGCGDGQITRYIANLIPEGIIYGTDQNKKMYENAIKNSNRSSNQKYFLSSIEDFKPDKLFDLAISFHVLHWIKNYQIALKKIHNLLKPKGIFSFIFCIKQEHNNNFDFIVDQLINTNKWRSYFPNIIPNYFNLNSKEEIINNLQQAGFHFQQLNILHINKKFHINDFRDWVKSWSPHLLFIPKNLTNIFLDELIELYKLTEPNKSLTEHFKYKNNDQEYILFSDYWIEGIVQK